MSEIVLNRVDDRLIHGQVMTGWLGLRRASAIWIADDAVATNPMMLDIFRFAAPSGIKIEAHHPARKSSQNVLAPARERLQGVRYQLWRDGA